MKVSSTDYYTNVCGNSYSIHATKHHYIVTSRVSRVHVDVLVLPCYLHGLGFRVLFAHSTITQRATVAGRR